MTTESKFIQIREGFINISEIFTVEYRTEPRMDITLQKEFLGFTTIYTLKNGRQIETHVPLEYREDPGVFIDELAAELNGTV